MPKRRRYSLHEYVIAARLGKRVSEVTPDEAEEGRRIVINKLKEILCEKPVKRTALPEKLPEIFPEVYEKFPKAPRGYRSLFKYIREACPLPRGHPYKK